MLSGDHSWVLLPHNKGRNECHTANGWMDGLQAPVNGNYCVIREAVTVCNSK